jgi:hypothetical protein
MSKLELKVEDKATSSVEIKPVLAQEKPPEGFKQKASSGWLILKGKEKNHIIATSDRGDKFEGHVKDFNKAMKV